MKFTSVLAFSITALVHSQIMAFSFPDKQNSFSSVMLTQERVEVKPDDLPEKVRQSVGYKTELGWNILKAYLVTNDDNSQLYELYVQKPDGETWMKVDKEGKVLN